MEVKVKFAFLVHLVHITSGFLWKMQLNSNGGSWVRPNGDIDPSKVTLVKRIVPHDYVSPPFEYDSRFHTIFVPKFRVEKRIDVNTNKGTLASIEELRQDNGQTLLNLDRQNNVHVSKIVDALLNELDTKNKKQHNNKADTEKLLFKSFKSYHLNMNDLLSKAHTGRLREQITENEPNESVERSGIISDGKGHPWEPIKVPEINPSYRLNKNDLLSKSHTGRLREQITENEQSESVERSGIISDGRGHPWEPIKVPEINPHKRMHNALLDDFKKTLENQQGLSSDELWNPRFTTDKKHYLEAIEPELLRDEKAKQIDKPFILYPNKNKKLQIYVRNLADLLKIWKYIGSKKYAFNPSLRERDTQNVELDIENPKPQAPFNFPHYSIWNFWTYDKTLLKDSCPGEQVKVGNMCIWTPPHRK